MSAIQSKQNSVRSVKSDVKRAGNKATYSPEMEALARIGYGVRGVIYVVMGLLALDVVFGKGGAPIDQQSAISTIGKQPAGLIFLWIVLIGLISYSLWGVVRAVMDPLHKGHDLKGLAMRAGFLFSAASYAILVVPTYRTITGAGSSGQSGAQTQQSMGSILSTPWGLIAIGLVGLGVIALGLYQIKQGFDASFDRQFQTFAMTAQEVKWATQLGRLGTATRGVIFVLIGGLLCLSAYQSNPGQGFGLNTALTTLLHQPYGIWLLGFVAIGLIAFGVYSMLSAIWFRLKR